MSDKFDAMMLILNKLNMREEVTLQSLMEDLQVGDRSVYRYIETLRRADYPIEYDQQCRRYAFPKGYTLGKIGLSTEEDLLFNLGREMLKGLGGRTQKVLDGLAKKIGEKKCLPKHIRISVNEQSPQVEQYLNDLNCAITDFLRVKLRYRTAGRENEESCRTIEPLYLYFDNGSWYVRAYCRMRKEMRLFNLIQITSLEILQGDYFIPKPEEGSPSYEAQKAFGAFIDGPMTDISLRFDKSCAPFITRQKWHPSQKIKKLSDGRLELTMTIPGITSVKHWIFQYLPHVEVLSPKELREEVARDLSTALGMMK
jgi:predicted DNA-binding transcriptional regulator YafY